MHPGEPAEWIKNIFHKIVDNNQTMIYHTVKQQINIDGGNEMKKKAMKKKMKKIYNQEWKKIKKKMEEKR